MTLVVASSSESPPALPPQREKSVISVALFGLFKMNRILKEHILAEIKKDKPVSPPPNPEDLFEESRFWEYSSPEAMQDWGFCLSRFREKEEVMPHVFIGTRHALVKELAKGDYTVLSEDAFTLTHESLLYQSQKAYGQWLSIKKRELGELAPKIAFKRVISIVADQARGMKLRSQVENQTGYKEVVEHQYVELPDLPSLSQEEERVHQQKWRALIEQFPKIFEMIDRARAEQTPLLIHCEQGRHRSVALLSAYLVNRLGLTVFHAMKYIELKRNCAISYLDSSFTPLLEEWAVLSPYHPKLATKV